MKSQYRITSIILLLLLSSSNSTAQQTPPKQPNATQAAHDDVVRITTNLVQIDAVVTDQDGKRVEDLKAEDFEVIVDGRKQPITNLSYNSYKLASASNASRVEADDKIPSVRPKSPDQVRRTIAFVVDNLCTSLESTHQARANLRKFINDQMQPNDLVAIIQTVGNTGVLQQFSTDKQFLLAAVDDIRFNNSSTRRTCERDDTVGSEHDPLALERNDPEQADNLRISNEVVAARWNIFTSGRMGAINLLLKGLRNVPGRKSLVLLTDNLPFPDLSKARPDDSTQYGELYRRLTDLANRASTVIYTVDLRGLPTLNVTAIDNRAGPRALVEQRSRGGLLRAQRAYFFYSKTGMISLAEQTGGFFVDNTNDISSGLRRAADDSDGYYLIGFRPDDEVFESIRGRVRFNQFELKVKRPGLKIRTRKGFYGFEDSEIRPVKMSPTDRLLSALISPFGAAALKMNLFSIFTAESDKKQFVSSLIHIDGNSLKFTEQPDGWLQAKFNVLAALFNADGIPVEQVNRTDTLRAKGATFERMLTNGIIYTLQVPVKEPGMYQLRVAVSDVATDKIGVSDQTVEVPDLGKNRFTLSNIVMRGTEASLGAALSSPQDRIQMNAGISESNPLSNPAIRRFRAGSEIECYFYVYNAQTSNAGLPALTTQLRLFRDGKLILAGQPGTIDKNKQTDVKRFLVGTRLSLGRDLSPGEYVLQVVVREPGAKGKERAATQSIDFTLL